MDQATAKQQIVERIKQANNVLVTVSTNPSVDQLSACIGATLMFNRLQKHATAVFSGLIPSTIEFLQPEKTLKANTDSLQDFIISLDKSKADKLRYKVEDQVVRIFITPYKASINEKDLVFSQGDFNVEVVLALGVRDRNQIDAAISAHGRILHDATVISLNAGQEQSPQVGQLNWQDPAASSLSEMLVSISEAFGPGLIDNQTATAFLTGIVAETQRFSNQKTSPKVMTMSAQLMAAGANQQLIVSNIEPPIPQAPPTAKAQTPQTPAAALAQEAVAPGTLNISHETKKPSDPEVEIRPGEIHIDEKGNIISPIDNGNGNGNSNGGSQPLALNVPSHDNVPVVQTIAPPKTSAQTPLKPVAPVTPPAPEQKMPPMEPAAPAITPLATPTQSMPTPLSTPSPPVPAPSNTEPKADSTEPEITPGAHTLLDPAAHKPANGSPFTADTTPVWSDTPPPTETLNEPLKPPDFFDSSGPLANNAQVSAPTLPAPSVDSARSAVQNAIAGAPFDPGFGAPVQALNAQPLSDIHTPQEIKPSDMVPPPPPPVPPPINFGQGVVIPAVQPNNNNPPPPQK